MIDAQKLREMTDAKLAAVVAEKRAQEERTRAEEIRRAQESERLAQETLASFPDKAAAAAREGKSEIQVASMYNDEFVGPRRSHSDEDLVEAWFRKGALTIFRTLRACQPPFRLRIECWDDRMSGYQGFYLYARW